MPAAVSPLTDMYDVIIVSPHVDYLSTGFPKVIENDMSSILPLGALYVTQHLHDKGYKTAFLHMQSLMEQPEYRGKSLREILALFPAKVCAIQCNWFIYVGGTAEVSRTYKELFPAAKTLAGGIHASTSYQELLDKMPGLDGVIRGEGERLLEYILQGKNWNQVPGLAHRENAGPLFIPATHEDAVPMNEIAVIDPRLPCYHGIRPDSYFYLNVTRGKCPYKCTYCVAHNQEVFHRKLEPLPLRKILDQLRIYKECGVKEVYMGETQFMAKHFLKELARALIKENIGIFLRLETHPMLFDEDTTKLLIEAGFRRFCMGSESGDDSMLSHTGRRYSSSTILKAVEMIHRNNGIVLTSWITNLPNETEAQFQETMSMMTKVTEAGGLIYWIENLFVLPGTTLQRKSAENNMSVLLHSFEDWRRWAAIAKSEIDFDHARAHPDIYLTHHNANTTPHEMMDRFVRARLHARDLVPQMVRNVMGMKLPDYIAESELNLLLWFQQRGHQVFVY